jgi:uncharacterized protein involved in exopolysaccharide biosynthesis
MKDEIILEKIPEKSLRDIYYILFRHRHKVIWFFLSIMAIVIIGTFLTSETYKSEAKLLVRLGRESVTLDPTATTGQVISVGQQRENEIKSEMEILTSQELVEKLVDTLGPIPFLVHPEEIDKNNTFIDRNPVDTIKKALQNLSLLLAPVLNRVRNLSSSLSDRDTAILTVMNNLQIEVLKNSNIISISFEAKDRKLAQETIDKLIGFYLEKHINVHRTPGSYEFFNQQINQSRNTLDQTEEDLKQFKNKTGIASLEEQKRELIKRIGDIQLALGETKSALAGSKAKVQAMEKTLADLPDLRITQESSGNPNQAFDLMRTRLYDLQLKEQDLLSKFHENTEPVKEIRRQINEAQTLLAKEERSRTQVTRGLNETFKQLESTLAAEKATLFFLQAKSKEQQAQLVSAHGELRSINVNEGKLIQVQREMNVQEANYRKHYERMEQARIDQAMEIGKISNISIVQPATYPIKPVRPKKGLNLALGLILGILGGVILAFFAEYMDHSFKRPEDVVERLRLPVLASIPDKKTV